MLKTCHSHLNKHSILSSKLGIIYASVRTVHWYHDFRNVDVKKDSVENSGPEFGHENITDKDRRPELYWRVSEGRGVVQRLVSQWGFAKPQKAVKQKQDVEKMRFFRKLDSLDFLESRYELYPHLPDDAKGAIGYITDEEKDTLFEHSDYGKLYKDASEEYRSMVLEDKCDGRPVYEWQIPSGLDEAYGYESISTAVDVLGNDISNNNLECTWKEETSNTKEKSITLKNTSTNKSLIICDISESGNIIKTLSADKASAPPTVVFQHGAEKLLTSFKSILSPTSMQDANGCALAVAWSLSLYYLFPYWPTDVLLSNAGILSLLGINGLFFYKTFFEQNDLYLKSIYKACRANKCKIVLGDWLYDDYFERLTHSNVFDEISDKVNHPTKPAKNFNEFIKSIKAFKHIRDLSHHKKLIKVDDVQTNEWIKTYRDAINNRRIDLLAHVLNNVEGENIIFCVKNIDELSSDIVTQLLKKRLCGEIKITKSPLLFDPYYERVQVQF